VDPDRTNDLLKNIADMYTSDKVGPGSDIINAIRMINELGGLEGYTNIGYADSFFEYWMIPPSISSTRLTRKLARPILNDNGDAHGILVVGCGSGGECVELYELTGRKIFALDTVKSNLISTEKLLEKHGYQRDVDLINGDAEHLPFEDKTFSAVYCCEAAFHFENKDRFLDECFRVLKNSGTLLIADIVKNDQKVFSETQREILHAYKNMLNAPNFYTKSDYIEQLEKIGFKDISLTDITSHNLKYMSEGTPYLTNLVKILTRLPKLKKMIEDRFKKHNIDFDAFLKGTQITYDAFYKSVSNYIVLYARK